MAFWTSPYLVSVFVCVAKMQNRITKTRNPARLAGVRSLLHILQSKTGSGLFSFSLPRNGICPAVGSNSEYPIPPPPFSVPLFHPCPQRTKVLTFSFQNEIFVCTKSSCCRQGCCKTHFFHVRHLMRPVCFLGLLLPASRPFQSWTVTTSTRSSTRLLSFPTVWHSRFQISFLCTLWFSGIIWTRFRFSINKQELVSTHNHTPGRFQPKKTHQL